MQIIPEWNRDDDARPAELRLTDEGIAQRRLRETAGRARTHDIERAIISALQRHAALEASKVRVSVEGTKVTLDGTLDALHERELIDDAVRHTAGVTDVVDNLAVGGA